MPRNLFDRLKWPPGGRRTAPRPASESSEVVRESVRRNLERVFNTRQGSSPACPRYGLPDVVEMAVQIPDGRKDLEDAIARCITTYEPRLTGVRVRYLGNPGKVLTASFQISARLLGRDVGFTTELGMNRPPGETQIKVA